MVVGDPFGNPVPGATNVFEYYTGTDVSLTCMVTPTPPSDSEFSWSCSTGCFADMEMEQTINVTDIEEMDSGVINCSVIIDGMEYFSAFIDLQVFEGKKDIFAISRFTVVICKSKNIHMLQLNCTVEYDSTLIAGIGKENYGFPRMLLNKQPYNTISLNYWQYIFLMKLLVLYIYSIILSACLLACLLDHNN